MEENKEIPIADTWRSLQAECPHCGHVQDVDEFMLGDIGICIACDGNFIAVESE
jgi:uncharacterized protein (DUF983 family)